MQGNAHPMNLSRARLLFEDAPSVLSCRRNGQYCYCSVQEAGLSPGRQTKYNIQYHPPLAQVSAEFLPFKIGSHVLKRIPYYRPLENQLLNRINRPCLLRRQGPKFLNNYLKSNSSAHIFTLSQLALSSLFIYLFLSHIMYYIVLTLRIIYTECM